MKTVVKVSLPISANVAHPTPLVYAEGRVNMVMQDIDKATRAALGGDVKGYFEATWDATKSEWVIGRRVGNRDW